MKILVTGGAGFIGSHLCERLLSERHELVVVDDLNDFYSPREKLANLDAVQECGRIDFFRLNIANAADVDRVVEQTQPETIIHLAARAGVRPSLDYPLLYERVNVQGTVALLDAARRCHVRKFIFASSSSVYGIANRVPFREDDPLSQPISPYAASKLAAEHFCYTYSHLYDLSVVCLRFFTVYGPRQRPDLAIRKFTQMIDSGSSLPVFGDGDSARDYTFVDDTVSGIVAALAYPCRFDVFNLGNSSPVKLVTLIRTIERALGKSAQLRWLPDQPGDVPITFADITRAQSILGYSPATPLELGIAKFVDWYRERQHDSLPAAVA